MSSVASRPQPDGFDPHAVPVRDAATVMVVRDGAGGLEVFMLRRTLDAVFAGGLYVFPGGAVDDADRHRRSKRCASAAPTPRRAPS